MLNRREFLRAALALPCLTTGLLSGQEPVKKISPINTTLLQTMDAARKKAGHLIHDIDFHLVDDASIGMVHLRWLHFTPRLYTDELPPVEQVNREIREIFGTLQTIPDAGADALMQEGMVRGRKAEKIQEYEDIYRTLVRSQLTADDANPASPETVEQEMKNAYYADLPVSQIVNYGRVEDEYQTLSPLARIGAGYFLHRFSKVDLLPLEDPKIDAEADRIENSVFKRGYEEVVFRKREEHGIKEVVASGRRMVYVLMGANHDFEDDVDFHNKFYPDKRISLVTLTPKGVTTA